MDYPGIPKQWTTKPGWTNNSDRKESFAVFPGRWLTVTWDSLPFLLSHLGEFRSRSWKGITISHAVTEEKQSALFPGCTLGCVGWWTGLVGPSPAE